MTELSMIDYLKSVVTGFVDAPEEIVVYEIKGEQTCVLELKVAKEDVGKVIGRQGYMADSLRNIIKAVGAKNQKRYVLQIID